MSPAEAAAAAALVWFGMVVAISFMEAPLKFRAPGITVPLGLGIGRIVFGALNIAEAVLAAGAAAGLALAGTWSAGPAWLAAAIAVLVVQLAAVRPLLRRRSAEVLAGNTSDRRSRVHLVYVGFEAVKATALLVGALLLLTT
ncbi:hypothetical protein [Nocardiopsis composta]|uniref:DUF4149 domain-containing protein n=1 Tax=Nocardiopsis composta TaxID=157465 RepID=A0A7W8VCK1_9ACTN|nr:hypothetical protein [Nocardiopsis composta]MBB5431018.1 hypothetical protein [Nocardiopsis composta]